MSYQLNKKWRNRSAFAVKLWFLMHDRTVMMASMCVNCVVYTMSLIEPFDVTRTKCSTYALYSLPLSTSLITWPSFGQYIVVYMDSKLFRTQCTLVPRCCLSQLSCWDVFQAFLPRLQSQCPSANLHCKAPLPYAVACRL